MRNKEYKLSEEVKNLEEELEDLKENLIMK